MFFHSFDGLEQFFQNPDVDRFMTWLFADGMWRLKRGLLYAAGLWILWILFKWVILDKPGWKYKNQKRALKALDKLDELDYRQLREFEEKSPLPEIRQAAQEKNRLGNQIRFVLLDPRGPRRFEEPEKLDFNSEKARQTEAGKLVIHYPKRYDSSVNLHRVTYYLPDDVKPSCPEAAEYRLELNYGESTVGSYTDGSSAVQSHVKGKLSRGSKPVWEDSAGGSAPPSEKYWSGKNAAGSMADATPIVMRAIRTVRNDRKSAEGSDALQK